SPICTLFPYTTLFRSTMDILCCDVTLPQPSGYRTDTGCNSHRCSKGRRCKKLFMLHPPRGERIYTEEREATLEQFVLCEGGLDRSEEHTSELQSPCNL